MGGSGEVIVGVVRGEWWYWDWIECCGGGAESTTRTGVPVVGNWDGSGDWVVVVDEVFVVVVVVGSGLEIKLPLPNLVEVKASSGVGWEWVGDVDCGFGWEWSRDEDWVVGFCGVVVELLGAG